MGIFGLSSTDSIKLLFALLVVLSIVLSSPVTYLLMIVLIFSSSSWVQGRRLG